MTFKPRTEIDAILKPGLDPGLKPPGHGILTVGPGLIKIGGGPVAVRKFFHGS